jgi:hypothetical protein
MRPLRSLAFFPLSTVIYTSFHFSALDALLKGTIPRNALSVCWFLFVGIFCYKKPNNRFWFMIIRYVIEILCCIDGVSLNDLASVPPVQLRSRFRRDDHDWYFANDRKMGEMGG